MSYPRTTNELKNEMVLDAESALEYLRNINRLAEETPLSIDALTALTVAGEHLRDFINAVRP